MAKIAAAQIEYQEGGRAIWIHNDKGVTVMRINCSGQVKTHRNHRVVCASADINVEGDINICLPGRKKVPA